MGSGGGVQAFLAWLVVAGCSCPARVHGGAAAPCALWGQRAEDSIAVAAWSRSADVGYGRVSENQGCGRGDPARVGEAGVMAGLRGRGAGAGALGGAELEERDGAVRHRADAHMHTRALGGTPPSLIARGGTSRGCTLHPPHTFRSPHLQSGRQAPSPCSLNLGLRGHGLCRTKGWPHNSVVPQVSTLQWDFKIQRPFPPYVSRDFSQPVCLFSQLQQLQQLLPPFHGNEKKGWAMSLATCAPNAALQLWPGGRLPASYPGFWLGTEGSVQGKAPC